MSAHPLVDALIAQKQSEINQEFENILKNIEEHYEDHEILINTTNPYTILQLFREKGFNCGFSYAPMDNCVKIKW